MPELTPLCELAKKYETDKGGWHNRYNGGFSETCHNYTPIYFVLFARFREDVRNVLEIGINSGASLRMWKDFFPNATIYGIDSNADTMFTEDRIVTVIADQGSPEHLRAAMAAVGVSSVDLIIDDGSHEHDHQVTSMVTLLPYLSERGMYIIEDMTYDCQPEILGRHVPDGFNWRGIKCGRGLGNAHCYEHCPKCHGQEGEQLLVIMRNG